MILQNIGQYLVAGRREPDRLPQPARAAAGGTGTAASIEAAGLLPEAAGRGPIPRASSPRGWSSTCSTTASTPPTGTRTRDTALVRRGHGRLPQGQRRGQARHDRRSLARRQAAEGGRDHAGQPVHLRQQARRSKARRSTDGPAHGRAHAERARGPLYFNAYLTNFTLEDFDHQGRPGDQGRTASSTSSSRSTRRSRPPARAARRSTRRSRSTTARRWPNLATLKSGDLVEIELEIDSKNDYEYLVFEDMKAAGFEPVEVRSGYNGNDLGAYVEFRDNRVVFFVRRLARGKHSVTYRMRAEIPGQLQRPADQGLRPCTPRS